MGQKVVGGEGELVCICTPFHEASQSRKIPEGTITLKSAEDSIGTGSEELGTALNRAPDVV